MFIYYIIGLVLLVIIAIVLNGHIVKRRLFKRACKLNYMGNTQEAIIIYDRLILLEPNNYIYYNNRGNCYYILDEVELARKDFLKSIELYPDELENYKAYENLSKLDSGFLSLNKNSF